MSAAVTSLEAAAAAVSLHDAAQNDPSNNSEFQRIYRKFFGDYQPQQNDGFEADQIKHLRNECDRLEAAAAESAAALRDMKGAKEQTEHNLSKANLRIQELEAELADMKNKKGKDTASEVSADALTEMTKGREEADLKLAKAELKIAQLETAVASRDVTLAAKEKELSSVHALYQTTRDVAERLLKKGKETTDEIRVMELNRMLTDATGSGEDLASTNEGSEPAAEPKTPELERSSESSEAAVGETPVQTPTPERPRLQRSQSSHQIVGRVRSVSPMRIVAPLRDQNQCQRPLSRPTAWAERALDGGCASPMIPLAGPCHGFSSPPRPLATDRPVVVVRKSVSPVRRLQSVSPIRQVGQPGVASPFCPSPCQPQRPLVAMASPAATARPVARSAVIPKPASVLRGQSPMQERRMLAKTVWTDSRASLQAVPRNPSPLRVQREVSLDLTASRSAEVPIAHQQFLATQVAPVERYLLPFRNL